MTISKLLMKWGIQEVKRNLYVNVFPVGMYISLVNYSYNVYHICCFMMNKFNINFISNVRLIFLFNTIYLKSSMLSYFCEYDYYGNILCTNISFHLLVVRYGVYLFNITVHFT